MTFKTPEPVTYEAGTRVRVLDCTTVPGWAGVTGTVLSHQVGKNFYGDEIRQHKVDVDDSPANREILERLPAGCFNPDAPDRHCWFTSWELEEEVCPELEEFGTCIHSDHMIGR